MKLKLATVLSVMAALAACGGRQDGVVKFYGLTPNTSLQKDRREIRTFCPNPDCGDQVAAGTEKCPDQKTCKAQIHWNEKEGYKCGFCNGSKACQACVMMEQDAGKCFNCKGAGYLTFKGRTPECPDCKGKTTCPICKGSQKCDYCGGEGFVSLAIVKERARKPGDKNEADAEKPEPAAKPAAAPPPAPAATPEPKPEEKKPEEKKEEK